MEETAVRLDKIVHVIGPSPFLSLSATFPPPPSRFFAGKGHEAWFCLTVPSDPRDANTSRYTIITPAVGTLIGSLRHTISR